MTKLFLLVCALASSAWAYPPGDYDYGRPDPSGSSSVSAVPPDSTSSSSTGSTETLNGDNVCNAFMCITAVVRDPNVEYTMTSTTEAEVGWMSIGFGNAMTNSPLIVMWENNDGQVTLSQRIATDYTEPEVDANPPRAASLLAESTSATNTGSSYSFSVPSDGSTDVSLLWAYSPVRPSSAAVDATIVEHRGMGISRLDLTNTVTVSSNSSEPASSPNDNNPSSGSGSSSIPLSTSQKMVIAHAILLVVGFLFILPLGSLTARYVRTFSDSWFKAHQALQMYVAGPIIIAGFALGVSAISQRGGPHLNTSHKNWGVAIFVLYLCQVGLGLFIHHVKLSVKRPPQNYFHAVFGIMIIALSFYQVRTGYKHEWTRANEPLPNVVDIVWYIWVVAIPLLYAAGLAFLPKQYRAERQRRRRMTQPKRLETGYVTGY